MSEKNIHLFLLNNALIDKSMQTLQKKIGHDLGYSEDGEEAANQDLYDDFPSELRNRADEMSHYYRIFYCLENSIRNLVEGRLSEQEPEAWWSNLVPQIIQDRAKENKKREEEQGFTPRSERDIDYLNFGDLGEIIKENWDVFGDTLKNKNAVGRIFATLNRLRGPIAHCSTLADDEIDRLYLSLKDWSRQLGA